MEIDDTFIITGGFIKTGGFWNAKIEALKTVVRYNSSGGSEDLPSLNVGRFFHACASYLDDYENRVS